MTSGQVAEGAVFAAVAALAAFAVSPSYVLAPTLSLALLATAYLLFLAIRIDWPAGSMSVVSGIALLLLGAAQFVPTLVLLGASSLLLAGGRSFLLARTLAGFTADAGLSLLAAIVAVGVLYESGSIPLAVWCYFLLQSFHRAIPERGVKPRSSPPDAFGKALRSAQRALQRLNPQITTGEINER